MERKPKSRLITPQVAAAMISAASLSLAGLQLKNFIDELQIKPHGRKDRNSGRGCRVYRLGGQKPTSPSQERECTRRVRQIASGIIPRSLVHPV